MNRDRLVLGLAAVFAGMTVTLVVVAAAIKSPVAAFVALPLAAATYVFWYQASGRLRERVSQRRAGEAADARRRAASNPGGFGSGPREFGFRGADGWDRRQHHTAEPDGGGQSRRHAAPRASGGPTRTEAYRTLGLEPGASDRRVKRAYRDAVKDAHPDRGGSEEEFRELTTAYERLI